MGCLTEREKYIVIHRFGLEAGSEPQILAEVAANLGMTRQRVQQVQRGALEKMRRVLRNRENPDRRFMNGNGNGKHMTTESDPASITE
jgi:DNA-directed RNA polymerase sigma subunit (sigma70/sigma32)